MLNGPIKTVDALVNHLNWRGDGYRFGHIEGDYYHVLNDDPYGPIIDGWARARPDFPLPIPEFLETRRVSGNNQSRFDVLLPRSTLILNNEEASELIDYVFERVERSISKGAKTILPRIINHPGMVYHRRGDDEIKLMKEYAEKRRYEIEIGYQINEREKWTYSIFGLVLVRYPSLVNMLINRGWEFTIGKRTNRSQSDAWYLSWPILGQ